MGERRQSVPDLLQTTPCKQIKVGIFHYVVPFSLALLKYRVSSVREQLVKCMLRFLVKCFSIIGEGSLI